MSAVVDQETRAGVAERWISSQAATPTPSQTPSPKYVESAMGKALAKSGNSPPAASPEPSSAPSASYSFAPSIGGNSRQGRTDYGSHPGPYSGVLPTSSGFANVSHTVPILPSAASAYSITKTSSNGHSYGLGNGHFAQSVLQQPSAHPAPAPATPLNFPQNLSHMSLVSAAENGLSKMNLFPRDAGKDGLVKDPRTFPGAPENFYPSAGNEKLYEAYNDLHSLAQNFQKPFDAPAILVVGHQTDGKSALVEALMGFQFNHVGGGTKTRRPITLHMKYNASCAEPMCFLVTDDKPPREEEKSLEDLQAYIETENMRLEREACQFWAKEIVVKIEYKYCPNLTIIDTPGLIAAAPGKKNQALQSQGRAVEALVRTKMQQKEFIILCLEDCSDWSNATTRRVVMQMDPDLARTVVVSTKLDTRIPQFARAADVEMFLRPPPRLVDGNLLGETPFFTSVPSGRVGSTRDAVYRSNDHFREAVALRESQDVAALEEKLDRPLLVEERSRVGVSRLRWFLEQLLQWRYMESVPCIVPLLDKEYRSVTIKLQQTIQELGNLDETKLKERGRVFRDSFLAKLSLLLKGTVVAPPEKFGELLLDERVHGGAFVGLDGQQMPHKHIPNASMRLYGGAQYHRAMAEFRFIVGGVKCPAISREEIVNACGVEDIHDGTNYFRTACVIAVAKARDVFEPFLHQLGFRLSHVLRRLLPIALYLLQRDGAYRHDMFMKRVSTAFQIFVEATERGCREKCMEDLLSTTRYVTWSLHNKNRSGLRQFLDTFAARDQPCQSSSNSEGSVTVATKPDKPRQESKPQPINGGEIVSGGSQTTQGRLVDLLESTLWNRRLAPSSEEIVNALVAQIFEGIRDHFVAAAELKFNCFFLMPVVDKFPTLLREDLEVAFDEDLDNVFDVAQARRLLEQTRTDLEWELRKVEKLQEKFASIHHHLSSHQPESPVQSVVCDLHQSD